MVCDYGKQPDRVTCYEIPIVARRHADDEIRYRAAMRARNLQVRFCLQVSL